ncbi:MAG: hypothetical protein IH840_13125 [Candidatus Heimdallarchaeota archaeon]|nr:hypothetical protein [Candidatus Heimdallarchaeota archaeon]
MDNLEQSSNHFKTITVEIITAFTDNKLVLILSGIAEDYTSFISQFVEDRMYKKSIRRMAEITIKPLNVLDASMIVKNGFSKLRIKSDENIIYTIGAVSSGDMSLIHHLSLSIAIKALKTNKKSVDESMLSQELINVNKSWYHTYKTYLERVENRRSIKLGTRVKILFIMAFGERKKRITEIKDKMSQLGTKPNISQEINKLTNDYQQIRKISYGQYEIDDARYRIFLQIECRTKHPKIFSKLAVLKDQNEINKFLDYQSISEMDLKEKITIVTNTLFTVDRVLGDIQVELDLSD